MNVSDVVGNILLSNALPKPPVHPQIYDIWGSRSREMGFKIEGDDVILLTAPAASCLFLLNPECVRVGCGNELSLYVALYDRTEKWMVRSSGYVRGDGSNWISQVAPGRCSHKHAAGVELQAQGGEAAMVGSHGNEPKARRACHRPQCRRG